MATMEAKNTTLCVEIFVYINKRIKKLIEQPLPLPLGCQIFWVKIPNNLK